MDKYLLQMVKGTNDNYEKTTIYKDGKVEIEIFKDGNTSKEEKNINFVNDLEMQLMNAYNIMVLIYDKDKNENCKINFNNHDFYSFDLYIDINLMIKNNKIKKLSVFDKYEKQKENLNSDNQVKEYIKALDEYEKEKNTIDISYINNDRFNNEREMITFKLNRSNDFKLGQSRFFSDTIDIADTVEIPKSLNFVGQLNLNDFAEYDANNLLPKNGILYFFESPSIVDGHFYQVGKVIYSNDMDLKRKTIKPLENDQNSILNLSVGNIDNAVEKFSDRYEEYNGNREYNSFSGEELNKIFGFYTDCQMSDEDIMKVSKKYVVLLQLGSDIYGEGVTTFLILEEDLKNNNFDNIVYKYVQS